MSNWSAGITERRTVVVRLAGSAGLVHSDSPRRVDLGPVFRGTTLVEDPVQAVGVDHVGSGDRDVVARRWHRRVIEAAGISVVGAQENALGMLGNDFHHKVRAGVVGA